MFPKRDGRRLRRRRSFEKEGNLKLLRDTSPTRIKFHGTGYITPLAA
jgi:hypothetical protein